MNDFFFKIAMMLVCIYIGISAGKTQTENYLLSQCKINSFVKIGEAVISCARMNP